METKQSQIKINLSDSIKSKIKSKASKYGISLAAYTRYLMIKDLEESDDLEFSKETLKNIRDAKSGKVRWIKVKNTDEYFDKILDKLNK